MMTTMAVMVGVLGIKGGTVPSNGQDLSGDDDMCKDSNNDINGGSVGILYN